MFGFGLVLGMADSNATYSFSLITHMLQWANTISFAQAAEFYHMLCIAIILRVSKVEFTISNIPTCVHLPVGGITLCFGIDL